MPYYKTKDGRELYLPEPIFKANPEPSSNPVDEVKKAADHIRVVSEVQNTAAQLVGLERLEKERKEMEEKLEKTKEELEKARQQALERELAEIKQELKKAQEQRDIPAIKELEHKLEEAREAYHREQLEALRKEIAELRKSGGAGINLAEEIKRIRETAQELGLRPNAPTETPPDILLQLKKMDHDLQIKLEEMRDERARREKEWQLTLKKWEEEREMRRAEIQQKYEAEREKIETLKSSFDRAVRIITRALTEEEEEIPSQISQQYYVEAGEGEMGEFSCPKCGSAVSIAPDAIKAICAGCGFTAPIKRVSREKETNEEQMV